MNPTTIEPKEAMGVDVRSILKSQSLSQSLREQITKADVDGDGIVNVDELLKVLETERMLRRERTLLIRIVIALAVACVLIIAAVVGLTYAVVHLSKDTDVQNNVLVSKGTSDAISTASMQATHPLKDLYKVQSMSELEGLNRLTIPYGDGISIFAIQDIHLVPGESIRFGTTSENVSITVSESGISISGDENNSTASRRRLMSDELEGTVSGQVLVGSGGKKDAGQPCSSNTECERNACGRPTAADGAALECCSSGDTVTYGGYDYCTKMPKEATCWSDAMCQTGNCEGNKGGLKKGTCSSRKAVAKPCSSNTECYNNACGRPTAADGAALECCSSGGIVKYGGYDYCKEMPEGATCWSDAMCQTGSCKGNAGGLQKGTCSSTSKVVGEACSSNTDCANNACGRPTAADGAALECCSSGGIVTYGGYDYCTEMPEGATCWSDAMCKAGIANCKGNAGGLQKGTCSSTSKLPGEACSSNTECLKKACGRPTAADGAALECCSSDATVTYGGYDYCKEMPEGATCWSDAMCKAGSCKGNAGGLQKGTCSAWFSKAVGEPCSSNTECKNNACARPTAADGAALECCSSGGTGTYAGYDYCTQMPNGSTCWSNAQCASDNCKGNAYGLKKGTCT